MITARSARGLAGAGDLGIQMPLSPMQGPPEDSLITGIGLGFYRAGNLMGATVIPQRRGAIAPTPLRPATISTALRPPQFLAPRPTLPAVPSPTKPSPYQTPPTVAQPTPRGSVTSLPPRTIAPTGRTAYWPQTPASPVPVQPPVQFPEIPSATDPSGYAATSPYDVAAPAAAAGVQTSYPPPYALATNSQTGETTTITAEGRPATVNADGTMTAQDGTITDTTGAVVGTDWLAWAKEHKLGIGIGMVALIGAVVVAKVVL